MYLSFKNIQDDMYKFKCSRALILLGEFVIFIFLYLTTAILVWNSSQEGVHEPEELDASDLDKFLGDIGWFTLAFFS